jgi:hypothetical protein
MHETQIPMDRPHPGVPEPVRHIDNELRCGLIHNPGRASLEAVFDPAETIQLELAVDGLVAPLRAFQHCREEELQTLRRAAGRATFSLRRVTDQLGQAPAPLAPAEAAVEDAVARADALGPVGINIGALLRHIDLHLRIARLWEGDTQPHSLFTAVADAPARVREGLADWRRFSDARFSPLECVEPGPTGTCRQLGYRFQGQLHPVHYAGERRTHQGLAWQRFRDQELSVAKRAVSSWQRLRAILLATE